MRIALLAVVVLVLPCVAQAKEPILPTSVIPIPDTWLVLPAPDHPGRRPVPVSSVFARYLFDPAAPAPAVGDSMTGERGTPTTWRATTLLTKGLLTKGLLAKGLGGTPGVGAAYFSVNAPRNGIWIAHMRRVRSFYVNGDPFVGDIYGKGGGVPVALRQGPNAIYLIEPRPGAHVAFTRPPHPQFVSPRDQVAPHVPTTSGFEGLAAVRLVNASEASVAARVRIDAGQLAAGSSQRLVPLCPLGTLQVTIPFALTGDDRIRPHRAPLQLSVTLEGDRWVPGGTLALPFVAAEAQLLHTFKSGMDDSIQPFGLRVPTDPRAKAKGLVLSLHGAGVMPFGQIRAYVNKRDLWIATPSNRGAFGFDWQDWGRKDAYEVLEHVITKTNVSRDRIYLTGHSMGGHGTWHLAANDPDTFAAIAPSAGWVSFDSYGGRPDGALSKWWRAADAASDTLALVDNLTELPTFILHGAADKTVPVTEAETMLNALRRAGGTPQHHFEPGAGHWWNGKRAKGADCVDWPELFALLRKSKRTVPKSFRWTTVDPSMDSTHHWVTVWQAQRYGEPSTVEARYDPTDHTAELKTTNVGCIALHPRGGISHLRIDGAVMPKPPSGRIWLRKTEAGWSPMARAPLLAEKHPQRQGPLRRGMQRRFVFVYGTKGHPDEDHALLTRARFDAQTWMVRANGRGLVVPDQAVLDHPAQYADRDLVLYGNADTNAAWAHVLGPTCPIQVQRNRIKFNNQIWRGADLGAAFVFPRKNTDRAHVVCLADTGIAGTRIGLTLSLFISGAGFPDYLIFGRDVLTQGDAGVLATGWFDPMWRVQSGGFVRAASRRK